MSKRLVVALSGGIGGAKLALGLSRVLRHVAYDLSDGNVKKFPALIKHLESKGKVAAMTKAASHLLWDDGNFSVIRDYLMNHTDWMISDTTGVPPRIAKKYGFGGLPSQSKASIVPGLANLASISWLGRDRMCFIGASPWRQAL